MKCSLGISNFLEEISSLSHSIVFLYFWSLRKAFLSLLPILWYSAFKRVYLSFSPHLSLVFVFVWLFHLANALRGHSYCHKISFFFFFLTLNSILVCVCLCGIFLICLFTDERLGCLCILATINNAAVNMRVQISFRVKCFNFLWIEYPEVEWLDHMIVLFLIFEERP